MLNAFTVDVEDYYHVSVFDGLIPRRQWTSLESRVERNTEKVLALLDRHRVRGTFFVLGVVADRHPHLVRRIAEAGHELASHGYAHRLVYDQTYAAFFADVSRARSLLEDAAGVRVSGFRAPSYSITPRSLWAFDALIEAGYRYDASVYPIRHDRYGIPVSARDIYPIERAGGTLVEVPGSAVRLCGVNLPVGGGGYFRLLPYWWTRWGLRRINKAEQRPSVFYIHPWELDPDQPRLPAGAVGRFRHYHNLHRTEARLARLLGDFEFGTMAEMIEGTWQTGWSPEACALALPYHW
jgi:polysaccharide deacetylase family protein (PEP-CTERM system associated)